MTRTLGNLSVEHMVLVLTPPAHEGRRGFPSWEGDNYVVRQHGAVRGTYPTVSALREDWPALADLIEQPTIP